MTERLHLQLVYKHWKDTFVKGISKGVFSCKAFLKYYSAVAFSGFLAFLSLIVPFSTHTDAWLWILKIVYELVCDFLRYSASIWSW